MALDEGYGKPAQPKPKKKRKPAPVMGEQATGGSKAARPRQPARRAAPSQDPVYPPWYPQGPNTEPPSFTEAIDSYAPFGADAEDNLQNSIWELLMNKEPVPVDLPPPPVWRPTEKQVRAGRVPSDVIFPVSTPKSTPTVAGGKFVRMAGGYLQEGARFTVDKQALATMRQVWAHVGPKYFPGQAMPVPVFIHEKNKMVEDAMAWVAFTPEGHRLLHWPKDMAKELARKHTVAVSTLLHEWAHVFQNYPMPDSAREEYRMDEGGATAFERRVLPSVAAKLKKLKLFEVPFPSFTTGEYIRFADEVEREEGDEFVLWGQFGGRRAPRNPH